MSSGRRLPGLGRFPRGAVGETLGYSLTGSLIARPGFSYPGVAGTLAVSRPGCRAHSGSISRGAVLAEFGFSAIRFSLCKGKLGTRGLREIDSWFEGNYGPLRR
jgi:hypothetical protein